MKTYKEISTQMFQIFISLKKRMFMPKWEALIYHFKIVMGEVDVPKGEVYNCVEEVMASWGTI